MPVFTIPFPISVNSYLGRGRSSKPYLKQKSREWYESTRSHLVSCDLGTIAGPAVLWVQVHPKNRRRYDVDNVQKMILDVIESAGLVDDDSAIRDIHVGKRLMRGMGECVCRLESVPPGDTGELWAETPYVIQKAAKSEFETLSAGRGRRTVPAPSGKKNQSGVDPSDGRG